MKQEKININIEQTPKREVKDKIKKNKKETYEIIMKKESNLDKKSKKGKISKSKVNSKTKNNEYDIILKENENDNENKLI